MLKAREMKAHERTFGWAALWAILLLLAMMVVVMVMGWVQRAYGQTWYTANQATVGWDAVTMLADGRPLPAGDVIKYEMFMVNAMTDPNKTNPVKVGNTTEGTTFLITLNTEGRYFVGIEALRFVGGVEVSRSGKVWCDDPAAAPVPFGLQFFAAPQAVTGMNVSGQ